MLAGPKFKLYALHRVFCLRHCKNVYSIAQNEEIAAKTRESGAAQPFYYARGLNGQRLVGERRGQLERSGEIWFDAVLYFAVFDVDDESGRDEGG